MIRSLLHAVVLFVLGLATGTAALAWTHGGSGGGGGGCSSCLLIDGSNLLLIDNSNLLLIQ